MANGGIAMNNDGLARQMLQTLEAAQVALDQIQADLDRVQTEHNLLIRTRDVCREWLDTHGLGDKSDQDQPAKPPISFAAAVRKVLVEANGEALHRQTIVERAWEFGARSEAKDIYPVLATACRRMNAEKLGKGYWRLPTTQVSMNQAYRPLTSGLVGGLYGEGVISRVGTPAVPPAMGALG